MKNSAIFFASFMTLIAAGMGFGVRGGILINWASQYGFTQFELGAITGFALAGFGAIILFASLIIDHIGYKVVLLVAFLLHFISVIITLAATPVFFVTESKDLVFWCLSIGLFLFSVANGLCEAAINPLTATLYPNQKTHYLNILHAGWPGGLVLGGLVIAARDAVAPGAPWELLLGLYLIPTLIYGAIVLMYKFPISEARAAGVSYGQMLLSFASPILLFLFLLHACVGYVELGTDSWIQNINASLVFKQAAWLFIWSSLIMFVLRFFAGPIVERINPLGLLLCSAVIGSLGLILLGSTIFVEGTSFVIISVFIWIAVTVYALGKTFLWPTMLGVVGERFPKGGALTMGCIGGIGMLSAGLLGGPGIGYKQDFFASRHLKENSEAGYQRYAAEKPNSFLVFPKVKGLDGMKVGVILDDKGPGTELARAVKQLEIDKKDNPKAKNEVVTDLAAWWETAKPGPALLISQGLGAQALTQSGGPMAGTGQILVASIVAEDAFALIDKPNVSAAQVYGGQMAMFLTAGVPAFMAVGYLLLVFYFRMTGGYKQEMLHSGEEYTGGVEGPVR